MNNRIRELAEQAMMPVTVRKWDEQNNMYYSEHDVQLDPKKFAELILQDIDRIVDELYRAMPLEQAAVLLTLDENIKEHFYGIEEPKGWVCPKCGIDRAKEACPNGHHAALTGHCPMVGVAQ